MNASFKFKVIEFGDLVPTVMSQVIFVAYMVFSVGHGLLVKASQQNLEAYSYNIVTVVLLIEVLKLLMTCAFYLKNGTIISLVNDIRSNLKVLCLYLIPSFLYCIYNNLAFINLSHFDPTTYYILLQLRVVMTGIVFQTVFNKKLSQLQWVSLVLLTCGCMVQELDLNYIYSLFGGTGYEDKQFLTTAIYFSFILIQTLCSCCAGVYNEHLLKGTSANVNIFVQNVFMYVDSIFWNFIVLLFEGNVLETFSVESLKAIAKPLVIAIIVNNALVGFTTSLFLKNLNSILKTFASAMELLFTAILSWVIFGIAVKLNTVVAIIIVSYSMYVYSKNPVKNAPKATAKVENQALLEEC